MARNRYLINMQRNNDFDNGEHDAYCSEEEEYADDVTDYEAQQYMWSNRDKVLQPLSDRFESLALATDFDTQAAPAFTRSILCERQAMLPKPKELNNKKKNATNQPPAPDAMTKVPTLKRAQVQRDAQALFSAERSGELPLLHLVVVGHVDAGKSTLMGHMLFELGNISRRNMDKLSHQSKQSGKSSFRFAWVLDSSNEERERGITMDVAQTMFETASKRVHLLDAPGHKDFIPNMIAGATQADCALLVVDAKQGKFETGFESGGQTAEHTLLVRSLGVSQLCVVVNKMDTCEWSEKRFVQIVDRLRTFLTKLGFAADKVQYVPVSGLDGTNLAQPLAEELCSWYRGPTLSAVIDNFTVPTRNIDLPMRMVISDIFQSSTNGVLASGRIETGVLAVGDTVCLYPLKEPVAIKSLLIDEQLVKTAFAGDAVSVRLSGVDMTSVARGNVLCDVRQPVQIAHSIEVRVVLQKLALPLIVGAPIMLHAHSMIESASVERLVATIDKRTGEVSRSRPRFLLGDTCALIVLRLVQPVCLDTFAVCKQLGRFALRIDGVTVGAGIVTGINK